MPIQRCQPTLMGHSYFEKQIIKCHIMVGKNTLKSLVLLLQAHLILVIPEKHFHILSLQIEKKKRKGEKVRDIFLYYFNNHFLVFQFGKMKGVLEMDGSDGK